MNKLVYLYELDSTRISPWEIDRGRKALYEEIVMRGNRVVLTFQQLTDSKIFLELLKDKKDFEIITSLFENGALRLSEYCDLHTGKRICSASQYLQNALKGGRTRFIFSNAPVNNEDLKVIQCAQEALQYCNLDSLRNLKQDVGQLENYIELMFRISIQQHAMNPVKEGSVYTLPYMINWVRRAKFDNENFQKLFLSGIKCLQDVKSKIIASRENLQSRSVWLKNLKEEKTVEIKSVAEAIVDLCYNYVVEDSIYNVSKRYADEKFLSDFQKRLYEFWKEYREGKHALMNGEYPLKQKIIRKLNWSVAKREWENVKLKKPMEPAILYKNVFWENRLWEWKVFLGNLKKWFCAFIYIAFFVTVMKKEAEFEKIFNGNEIVLKLYTIIGKQCGNWIVGIITVVIAGIISSLLLKNLKIPDILESIQTIAQVIMDFFSKLRFRIIKRFL